MEIIIHSLIPQFKGRHKNVGRSARFVSKSRRMCRLQTRRNTAGNRQYYTLIMVMMMIIIINIIVFIITITAIIAL